jgi:hypothetical protein
VLLVAGVVVALKPFRGSLERAGAARSVACGAPARAVAARDTRPVLAALGRLPRAREAGRAPSSEAIARVNRLVRAADRYVACRHEAVRRMTIADVMVLAALVLIVGCVWWPQADRVAGAPAAA